MSKKLIISAGLVCSILFYACGSNEQETINEAFVVRIPPYFSPDLSDGERNCVYEHWLYRSAAALDSRNSTDICKGVTLPEKSNPAVLFVRLGDKDEVTLNGGSVGRLSYLEYSLTVRLAEIFTEREKNRMYEPDSTVVEKTVHVRLQGGNRTYGDLLTIVDAVRSSGATAIVLVLNDDLKFLDIRPKFVVRNKTTPLEN